MFLWLTGDALLPEFAKGTVVNLRLLKRKIIRWKKGRNRNFHRIKETGIGASMIFLQSSLLCPTNIPNDAADFFHVRRNNTFTGASLLQFVHFFTFGSWINFSKSSLYCYMSKFSKSSLGNPLCLVSDAN